MRFPFHSRSFLFSTLASATLLTFSGCGGSGNSPTGMPYWLQPGTQLTWTVEMENVSSIVVNDVEITNPDAIREELQYIVPGVFQATISSVPYTCLVTGGGVNWNGTYNYKPQSADTFDFSVSLGSDVSFYFYDCSIKKDSIDVVPTSWQWEHRAHFLIKGNTIKFFKFNTSNTQS